MSEFIRVYLPVAIGIGTVMVLWFLFRNKATKIESTNELDAKIGKGQPVVLEFFTNT